MMKTHLCYGIPNATLHYLGGGEMNPAAFAGHKFVIFFCPSDPEGATNEIDDYCGHAKAFVEAGAWVLGVLSSDEAIRSSGKKCRKIHCLHVSPSV